MVSQCQSKKNLWAGHENMSKKPINLTLRSKFKVVSHRLMANTHVSNMASQCQSLKKLCAGHEYAQTDGQTDGQTDRVIPIYPLELRSRGV